MKDLLVMPPPLPRKEKFLSTVAQVSFTLTPVAMIYDWQETIKKKLLENYFITSLIVTGHILTSEQI